MRPVNLIPPEDRRGDRAPLRSGPLSYIVVGALGVVLLAVTLLVTTKNDIADKEAQVDQLERRSRRRDGRGGGPGPVHRVRRAAHEPRGNDRQPRPEPLRLGAGHARAGGCDPRGRNADQPERIGRRQRGGERGYRPRSALRTSRSPAALRRIRRSRRSLPPSRTSTASRESASRGPSRRRERPDRTQPSEVRHFAAAPTPLMSRSRSTTRPSAPRLRMRQRCPPPRRLPSRWPWTRRHSPRRPRTTRGQEQTEKAKEGRERGPGSGDAMKPSDRAILVGLLVAGAFAAFWFLALAPQA